MDIALPRIGGIEAFNVIQTDVELQHVRFVPLIASIVATERKTILAHGFDACITKPIDEKDFFKTINPVLYGR